jgi:RNA polymerase sigma factor (TIGR02999 family)
MVRRLFWGDFLEAKVTALDERITQTLARTRTDDPHAADQLLPLVYEQLRDLARQRLAHEPAGLTLQATALVHEAFLRVAGDDKAHWDHRGHFFAAAAEAMRRILIERARHYQRLKHGGGRRREEIQSIQLANTDASDALSDDRLIDLDDALRAFETDDPRRSEVVKLRYFAGLSIEQSADVLGISPATVSRHWEYARAWLSDWILEHGADAAASPPRNP